MRHGTTVLLVVLVSMALGLTLSVWLQDTPPPDSANAVMGRLPAASFTDLEGNRRSLTDPPDRIKVVNFWATWCPPCRAEIPDLIAIQNDYGPRGVQILGVAIDEPGAVRSFSAEIGANYPILLATADVIGLARRLGNESGGLPYTLLVDRDNRIIARYSGQINRMTLEKDILTLIEKTQGSAH